jgi:hypothetical protein
MHTEQEFSTTVETVAATTGDCWKQTIVTAARMVASIPVSFAPAAMPALITIYRRSRPDARSRDGVNGPFSPSFNLGTTDGDLKQVGGHIAV